MGPLEDWGNCDIVLLALALDSGATVQGVPGVSDDLADRLTTRLFDAVKAELQRREVNPIALARTLVARATLVMPKEE